MGLGQKVTIVFVNNFLLRLDWIIRPDRFKGDGKYVQKTKQAILNKFLEGRSEEGILFLQS